MPAELILARDPADLPAPARALFGRDLFSTEAWFTLVAEQGLAAGWRAEFAAITDADGIAAVLPLARQGSRVSALACPYTLTWRPLLGVRRRAADQAGQDAIAAAVLQALASDPAPRFDAIPQEDAAALDLLRGLPGRRALEFAHFGNWHLAVGGWDWARYLESRPGSLRTAIRRRGRAMARAGGEVVLHSHDGALERGIAAYAQVYARSWKRTEPYPGFNPALMRMLHQQGWLRLGVLWRGGTPVAAQFWAVHGGTAYLLKLAHDEAERSRSPGTVLTAAMLQAMLGEGGIERLDFGRGSDAYKQAWTGSLRGRRGVILADPRRLRGMAELLRARLSGLRHLGEREDSPGPLPGAGGSTSE